MMDPNGATSTSKTRVQPPTHPFFQPRKPQYTAPPNASSASPSPSPSPVTKPETTTKYLPPLSPRPNTTSNATPLPAKTNASSLPPPASISYFQQEHVEPLRRINSLLLPISYPDSFYKKILAPDAPLSFSRVILWQDSTTSPPKVIGGIVCRIDPALAPNSTPQTPIFQPGAHDIYIQSLVLLSPYRGKGLVAAVLAQVIEAATSQQELRIESLYAHAWTQNEEALQWYTARGFKKEESILHGYYRRLNPDTAWIFRRKLNPSDHLQHSAAHGTQLSQPQASPAKLYPSQLQPIAPAPGPPSPGLGLATNRPSPPSHARSFQDRGPDREWNDLPDEVLLKAPSLLASKEGSAASSRSSSRSGTEKGKKKRVYPTAAYGS